LGSMVQNVFVR